MTDRFQERSCVPDRDCVAAIAKLVAALAESNQVVLTHGIGRSPLSAEVPPASYSVVAGYLLEQELINVRPSTRIAHVLTQNMVDSPADDKPTTIAESNVIRAMLDHGYTVICSGIGGTPMYRAASGRLELGSRVVDKDDASALLARQLNASCLMLLTDAQAVYAHYGSPQSMPIRACSPQAMSQFNFDAQSMGAKVRAACEFAARTTGRACIGSMDHAEMVFYGYAGTTIRGGAELCFGND